ncbi:MAG: MMPL family transporter, partial [Spirochaetes bacterium]|nr:MMPL family transporter [Spirochaetota bacterium]
MQRFSEIIIKRRKIIIILTIVVTLFFMLGFTRITINSDITSYLKPNDPAMKLFNRIGEDYGGNLMVMIAVVSDSIISSPTLNFLKTVTENYSEIDGVSSITSLINIIDIKDTDFGLEVGKLIDKNNIPENERELEALKKYILSKDSYRGKIISEDGTTTIIICRLDPDYNKVELSKRIKDITEEVKGSYRVYYSGYPVQMMEMNGMLAGDLKILIPIVLVVITLVLFFSFKTIRGVVLPPTFRRSEPRFLPPVTL